MGEERCAEAESGNKSSSQGTQRLGQVEVTGLSCD